MAFYLLAVNPCQLPTPEHLATTQECPPAQPPLLSLLLHLGPEQKRPPPGLESLPGYAWLYPPVPTPPCIGHRQLPVLSLPESPAAGAAPSHLV